MQVGVGLSVARHLDVECLGVCLAGCDGVQFPERFGELADDVRHVCQLEGVSHNGFLSCGVPLSNTGHSSAALP